MNQNPEQLANTNDWLKIDPADDIPANFNRIAAKLFNDWLIQVNENCYRILELEFYYNDGHGHKDFYTHGHAMQKTSGHWYFHYSGIDLTFGSENIYGGILIRSVEKIQLTPIPKEEQYFFGPLKTQMELLNSFHPALNGEANVFQLVPADGKIETVLEKNIVQSYRIGLPKKEGEDYKYREAQYRYLIHPHLAHKEKTNIALALKERLGHDPEMLDTIKELLGSEFLKEFR